MKEGPRRDPRAFVVSCLIPSQQGGRLPQPGRPHGRYFVRTALRPAIDCPCRCQRERGSRVGDVSAFGLYALIIRATSDIDAARHAKERR